MEATASRIRAAAAEHSSLCDFLQVQSDDISDEIRLTLLATYEHFIELSLTSEVDICLVTRVLQVCYLNAAMAD